MPGSYPRRSLIRELSGQYPELFKSLKTPQKQTKNPPTHLKADGGSLILNTHWNPTVRGDAESREEKVGLRHRGQMQLRLKILFAEEYSTMKWNLGDFSGIETLSRLFQGIPWWSSG